MARFSPEEASRLRAIAVSHGVSGDLLLRLLEIEAAFQGRGRRTGLLAQLSEAVLEASSRDQAVPPVRTAE